MNTPAPAAGRPAHASTAPLSAGPAASAAVPAALTVPAAPTVPVVPVAPPPTARRPVGPRRTAPRAASPRTSAQRRLIAQTALGARMLSLDGHDDFNQGQISARMPGATAFFIKNALCGFDEAGPDDVVEAPVDDREPAPRTAPPELPLHQAIYQARPDVNAVVHSHAPYTLVFGATGLALRPVSHDGAYFVGRTGLFTDTSNTVLDIGTGAAIAAALGDRPGVFLRNHGGVVVGKSVRHAAVLAQVLEHACRLQLLAEGSGAPYAWSNERDVALKRDFVYADLSIRSYWDHAVRRVVRVWPECAPWLAA